MYLLINFFEWLMYKFYELKLIFVEKKMKINEFGY